MLSTLLRWLGRLAYALLIVLVFTLAAYTSFSVFVRSGATTVPSVVGLSRVEAANVLADQGLILKGVEGAGRYDDKLPAGQVARQSPDARTLVKRGSPDAVVMSLGPRWVDGTALLGNPLPAAPPRPPLTRLATAWRIEAALRPSTNGGAQTSSTSTSWTGASCPTSPSASRCSRPSTPAPGCRSTSISW